MAARHSVAVPGLRVAATVQVVPQVRHIVGISALL